MKKLKAIIEFADNNYSAYLENVDGFMGIGKTIEGVKKSLLENIEFTIEGMKNNGIEIPDCFKGDYIIYFAFDVTTFLQVYGRIINKAGLEKLTGINQKQLWHYASGKKKPRKETIKKISDSVHILAEDLMKINFA